MAARESAIDICFPELAPLIDQWRMATVPVALLQVLPHITLLYPWRSAPLRTEDTEAVRIALAGVPAFDVTFSRLGRFPGVLFLTPEPDDLLRALMQRLTKAFPETPPYGGQFGAEPTLHLTVAQAETEAALDLIFAEVNDHLAPLLPLRSHVRKIIVHEEQADGNWKSLGTVELG